MRQRRAASKLVLPAILALAACGPPMPDPAPPPARGQSLEQAVRMMCDVDKLAGLAQAQDVTELGLRRTEWVNQHIENPDAVEFNARGLEARPCSWSSLYSQARTVRVKTKLSVKPAGDQTRMQREEAAKVGLAACPLADSIAKDEGGVIAP